MAKSSPDSPKTYSVREQAGLFNNALLAASRSDAAPLDPVRLRRLHDYAAAVIAPCKKHVEQGLLTAQELVVVCLSCALIVHTAEGGLKVPMVSLAEEVTGDKKK